MTQPQAQQDKYADLRKMQAGLIQERDALVSKFQPYTDKREALAKQIQPLSKEQKLIDDKLKAEFRPRKVELDNQIAALARAMGAKSMSDGK